MGIKTTFDLECAVFILITFELKEDKTGRFFFARWKLHCNQSFNFFIQFQYNNFHIQMASFTARDFMFNK